VKDLNQEAAKLLSRGKYEASAAVVESAKRAREFISDVEALRVKWRSQGVSRARSGKTERTPLWEYYALISRALVELGGEAARPQVEEWFSGRVGHELKAGDLEESSKGKPVWQKNLVRAKRAMAKEGYLEPGARWKLTRLGRNLPKQRPDGKD
jgi:hypothetical protein